VFLKVKLKKITDGVKYRGTVCMRVKMLLVDSIKARSDVLAWDGGGWKEVKGEGCWGQTYFKH
jgi:hypothetical protein